MTINAHRLFNSRPPIHNFRSDNIASWRLAWGKVDHLTGAVWQDNRVGIFLNSGDKSGVGIAHSPSGRFVVTGEAWLKQEEKDDEVSALEIIAQAWENEGKEILQNLVGMFALAIYDREEQKLYLVRDRTGSRTLYYTTEGATRWAGLELRSRSSYHSQELDLVALRDYLCCGFVPGEKTMWREVRELRPGTIMSLPEGKIAPYWQLSDYLPEESAQQNSLEWHSGELRTLLDKVVQEYLPPEDEDVGVFLSGGLDSSCITALVSKFHNAPVHTYSIHFGEKLPNELEFSSLVAQHCGTKHHILEIPLRQLWQKLPETMSYLDDPIGDPLTVPNLLLGRLARQSVRVILNGEGGDPCFGGPKNQPMLINQLYGGITRQNPLQAYLLAFQKCAGELPQLLKPDVWQAVESEPYVFSEDLEAPTSYLNRLMALNIKFKGADHILTKVNNLTKAAGLQGRSPLFDQRIVEMSMGIPPEYKLSGVEEKAVLKQAVADLLPREILYRPKSGMMVPVQIGFRDYWQREAKALLLNRKAAIAPYLNQNLIREWLNYRGDTWKRYGVKLWLLVSLELWLQNR